MRTKQKDNASSTGNVNETTNLHSNSEQLIERTPIEGTPYNLVKYGGDKHILELGLFRLCEPKSTAVEVLKEAREINAYRVLQLAQVVVTSCDETRQLIKDITELKQRINDLEKTNNLLPKN